MSVSVYQIDANKPNNLAQKIVSGVIGAVSIAFPAVGAAAAAVTAVTSIIGKIGDSKKRAQFEKDFAALSNSQKIELNKKIQAQQDLTAQLDVLSDYLTQAAIANEQLKDDQLVRNYIIISSIAVVFLVGIIYYKVKSNKD